MLCSTVHVIFVILIITLLLILLRNNNTEGYTDYEVTIPPVTEADATIKVGDAVASEIRLIRELEPYYKMYASLLGKYYLKRPLREVEDKIVASDEVGEVYPLSNALRAIDFASNSQLEDLQKMKSIIDLLPIRVNIYQTTVEFLIVRAKELLKDLAKKNTANPTPEGAPSKTIKLLSKTISVRTEDYAAYLKQQQQQQQPVTNSIKLYQITKSRNSRYSELTSMPSLLEEARGLYNKLASLQEQLYSESSSSA